VAPPNGLHQPQAGMSTGSEGRERGIAASRLEDRPDPACRAACGVGPGTCSIALYGVITDLIAVLPREHARDAAKAREDCGILISFWFRHDDIDPRFVRVLQAPTVDNQMIDDAGIVRL
jgi:hypothetical protein